MVAGLTGKTGDRVLFLVEAGSGQGIVHVQIPLLITVGNNAKEIVGKRQSVLQISNVSKVC